MSLSVLVADDEPGMRDMLRWELETVGHEVTAASDGAEAIARLEAQEFDVVVSDITMPKKTGIEVLRRARELSADLDVIIVTGYAELSTAIECLRSGATDLMQKPFEASDVLRVIDRVAERRRVRDASALYQAGQAILANPDPQRLPEVITELAMKVMSADGACLFLPGHDGLLYSAESAKRGCSVCDHDVDAARLAALAAKGEPALERSRIVYPLRVAERLSGVLVIRRVKDARAFRKRDVDRAGVLASQVLLALENRRLMQTVASSERLAGIGQLAAGVAHEINNPVACVLSASTALRAELDDLEALAEGANAAALKSHLKEMREILADSDEGAGRIREIARDLRSLSRSDEGSSGQAEVSEVVASAMRVAGVHLKRSAQVTTRLEPGLVVHGAPGKLSQVLINLLVNAAQAMAGRPGARNEITVSSRREADRVIVEVADTGPGIKPEHLPRMFEPFFTTKDATTGTGLGLAISRDIIRLCGGQLSVRSVYGQGATFTLELKPVADE